MASICKSASILIGRFHTQNAGTGQHGVHREKMSPKLLAFAKNSKLRCLRLMVGEWVGVAFFDPVCWGSPYLGHLSESHANLKFED